MKKHFLFLLPLSAILLLTACQKEVSTELTGTASAGSLQANATGECLPKTIQGIYSAGKVLNADSNYIDLQVNVTVVGSYRVYSDTINGVFFESKGTFASAGLNTVRLAGGGTPLVAGIHSFTITYDSTECIVAITTLAQGGGGDAEFTLAGDPDVCMNYVLAGDYIAGVPMTPANTVVITVDVTIPGTYNLATTVSNGISFSGSGSFTNLGQQTITLTAAGTPGVAGSTNMPLTFDGSSCSFSVNVTTTAITDYFPRTASSNWSYQYDDDANDSLFIRAKAGVVTLAGNSYTVFEGTVDAAAGFGDFGNYRKAGGDYHTYADMGDFFGFDNALNVDYIFLKDNIGANSSWQTAAFSGTITDTSGTFPLTIRISFTIAQKDVTVTIGGISYPNTIVVNEKYEVQNGPVWLDATPLVGYYKSYYARNIGLIKQDQYYEDGNANPTTVVLKQDIRRYQVY